MLATPHLDKLQAALDNPKCAADRGVLGEAKELYDSWVTQMNAVAGDPRALVDAFVRLLNWYKDALEVDLIMKRGTPFLRRQKGQLKLDNSVLEEFLVRLVRPGIIGGIEDLQLVIGPSNTFMSLSFQPRGVRTLAERPEIVLKSKDQDFVIGGEVHYMLSPDPKFPSDSTATGSLVLAVLAAECKVNLDKTMFQEAAGTATRMKQGCPTSRYYIVVEYLDMQPEDCRLTDIDNVYLLRRAKRLPFDKRSDPLAVERQHKEHPIDPDVVWRFVQEIQAFVGAVWFDPDAALRRGSFV